MKRAESGCGENAQFWYSVLQVSWWALSSACCAFAAIFLGAKGMSNTMIGLVTGGASICSIALSPLFARLLERVRGLTIPRLMNRLLLVATVAYLSISFLPATPILIGTVYLFVYAALVGTVPLLAQLSMDCIRLGRGLNFGLSRGLGSLSYALSAVVLSMFVERLSENILAVVFTVCSLVFIYAMGKMPQTSVRDVRHDSVDAEQGTMSSLIRNHPVLFAALLGFMFCTMGSSSTFIYLIDVIENLGGDTALYGIAVFCNSASELPAMALVPLLRKHLSVGQLFCVAGVAYVIRNLAVAFAPNVAVVFVGLAFQSASYGILTSLLTYFISEQCGSGDEMRGQALMAIMTTGIGSTVGTVMGGTLQDSMGLWAVAWFSAIATILGSLALVGAGFFECGRWLERSVD